MTQALIELAAYVFFVTTCCLGFLYFKMRDTCLEVSKSLVIAHRELRILKQARLTPRQQANVNRELLRQQRKHETHEMMRRGSFAKPKKRRGRAKGQ